MKILIESYELTEFNTTFLNFLYLCKQKPFILSHDTISFNALLLIARITFFTVCVDILLFAFNELVSRTFILTNLFDNLFDNLVNSINSVLK